MIAGALALVLALVGTAAVDAPPPSRPKPPTSMPARADVLVEVTLGGLDLEVEGWAKGKVDVDSDISHGFEARLEEDGDRLRVVIDGPSDMPASGTIKLRVPKTAELQIATKGGNVRGTNLLGRATVASISGDVRIAGAATRIEVATTSGDVDLDGANGRVDVATVSGRVHFVGVRGEVRVESVSGDVQIGGGRLDRLQLTTVSGAVEATVELRKGPHRIDTSSGDVRMNLPLAVPLRIVVSSFSGSIVDELGDRSETHENNHRRELGKGGGTLEIATFSGDVTLARQRGS